MKPASTMLLNFTRCIIALMVFPNLPVFAAEVGDKREWKLNPLEYNNPGLKVDLGVGLWAWPMPMDYDKDGDMDLLVACPSLKHRILSELWLWALSALTRVRAP